MHRLQYSTMKTDPRNPVNSRHLTAPPYFQRVFIYAQTCNICSNPPAFRYINYLPVVDALRSARSLGRLGFLF